MRWRQIQGAHFDASITDLNLEPQYDWDLELPDPVHHQSLTFAHGTTWAGAYGVISESLLRPQAAKSDCYPSFGAFGRGSIEAYTEHTSSKALESVARKSKGQTVVLLCSAIAFHVQVIEGGIDKVQSAVRRDHAAKSASDGSLCVRSEAATIRGVAFLWPK